MLIASMIMMAGCGSSDSDAGEQAAEQEQAVEEAAEEKAEPIGVHHAEI